MRHGNVYVIIVIWVKPNCEYATINNFDNLLSLFVSAMVHQIYRVKKRHSALRTPNCIVN